MLISCSLPRSAGGRCWRLARREGVPDVDQLAWIGYVDVVWVSTSAFASDPFALLSRRGRVPEQLGH